MCFYCVETQDHNTWNRYRNFFSPSLSLSLSFSILYVRNSQNTIETILGAVCILVGCILSNLFSTSNKKESLYSNHDFELYVCYMNCGILWTSFHFIYLFFSGRSVVLLRVFDHNTAHYKRYSLRAHSINVARVSHNSNNWLV